MDTFSIGFDFATTDRPAEVAVYNQAHDVVLSVGDAGREIHGEVTLRRVNGVVSVAVALTWHAGMGRDRARAAFEAALRQGPTFDTKTREVGPLKGSHAFLSTVRDALAEGASIR